MMDIHIQKKKEKWWYLYTILPVTITAVITYFDILNHYWFLKVVGGYVINIWIFPCFLFFFFLFRQFIDGNLVFPRRNIGFLLITLFLYFLSGTISLIAFESTWNIIKYFFLMFAPAMLCVSIIYGFRDNREIEKVLQIFFMIALVFAIYGFYIHNFAGPESWRFETIQRKYLLSTANSEESELNPTGGFASFYISEERGTINRLYIAGIYDVAMLGSVFSPLILVGLYFAMISKKHLKLFYYISTALLFYMVVATLSRASITALLVGLILFLFHKKSRLIEMAWGIIIVIIVAVVFLFTEGVIERFLLLLYDIGIFRESELLLKLLDKSGVQIRGEPHVAGFYESLKVFEKAPFFGMFGIGTSNFWDIFGGDRPHSRFLVISLTTGFITLIPYVGFLITLAVASRKAFLRKLNIQGLTNNIGLILYPAVVLLTVKLFYEPSETYYNWIFFGLAAAWIRNCAYEQKHKNTFN